MMAKAICDTKEIPVPNIVEKEMSHLEEIVTLPRPLFSEDRKMTRIMCEAKEIPVPDSVNKGRLYHLESIVTSPRLLFRGEEFTCMGMDWEYMFPQLEEMVSKDSRVYQQIKEMKPYLREALAVAVKKNFTDLIALLICHDLDVQSCLGLLSRTLLHYAVDSGDITFVFFLISLGANVETKDILGYSSLHIAAVNGNVEMMKLLLTRTAVPCPRDILWRTPLYYAVENSHINILKLYLSLDIFLDIRDIDGKTLLHAAALQSERKIFKLLLKNKLKVNSTDKYGNSPLHVAVLSGHLEAVRLLIKKHARVNCYNNFDMSPFRLAVLCNRIEILRLLLLGGVNIFYERNVKETTLLHWAASTGDVLLFDMLCGLGFNVRAQNRQGKTALDVATSAGHDKIVSYIVDHIIRREREEGASK